MTKITNTNILSAFRKQVGISKADEIAFVEAFQSIFEEALLRDKVVKISGLGSFKLIPVESRKSVNVNTGEEFEIASHYKLTFTPDASLKDKVNEPLAHLETTELSSETQLQSLNKLSVQFFKTACIDCFSPVNKVITFVLHVKYGVVVLIEGLTTITTSFSNKESV